MVKFSVTTHLKKTKSFPTTALYQKSSAVKSYTSEFLSQVPKGFLSRLFLFFFRGGVGWLSQKPQS